MTNETMNAIEILANKLGTTSEYLWGVLLKQAPISAITDLIQYALIIFACTFWIKKVKTFADKISDGEWEETSWAWIGVVSVILGIFVVCAFLSFPNTFYALVNPEYWALNKLLLKLN